MMIHNVVVQSLSIQILLNIFVLPFSLPCCVMQILMKKHISIGFTHGRTGVVNALEEFKHSIYGENYDEEKEFETNGKVTEASKKRKAIAENAVQECANYDWADLADNGKVTFYGFVLNSLRLLNLEVVA